MLPRIQFCHCLDCLKYPSLYLWLIPIIHLLHHWKRMFHKCVSLRPIFVSRMHSIRMAEGSWQQSGRACIPIRRLTLRNDVVRGSSSVLRISLFQQIKNQSPMLLYCNPTLTRRDIQTEREYIPLADQTLEAIQDAVDSLFERQTLIEYEVSLSSGVLTLKFPPHGTWVINKQTPNLQIWVRDDVSV